MSVLTSGWWPPGTGCSRRSGRSPSTRSGCPPAAGPGPTRPAGPNRRTPRSSCPPWACCVPAEHPAIKAGLRWLLSRQNKDGSWSEWVRNSSMIHDGPCAGVTAHVISALRRFGAGGGGPRSPVERAFRYFETEQGADGGIPSLWFRDRTHGTAKVLETYAEFGRLTDPVATRARQWLRATQRPDGSWPMTATEGPDGGTAEETGWALYALLRAGLPP